MFLAPLSLIHDQDGIEAAGSFGGVINANHRVPSKNHDAMLLRDRRLSLAQTVFPGHVPIHATTCDAAGYDRVAYLDRKEAGAVTRQQIEFIR